MTTKNAQQTQSGSTQGRWPGLDFTDLWQPVAQAEHPRQPEGVLLDEKIITPEQLDQAKQQQQAQPHQSILELLMQAKVVNDVQAYQAVATAAGLPFMRLTTSMIDSSVLQYLPFDYLRIKRVIPMSQEDGKILVGIADPTDIFVLDDIRRRLKSDIRLVVVPPSDIVTAIDELVSPVAQQMDEILKGVVEDTVEVIEESYEEVADLQRVAGESPVIRYVNYLVSSAARECASDIHIEPGEKTLTVRYRVDGILFEREAPPLSMHAAIVSRLKIMAGLDIAERRLPQDGRIHVTVQSQRMDLRVSTIPTTCGEKCVIRILDNRSILLGLESLGMASETMEAFRRQVLQPHGIVLVTGPTGSGKSTTLYSALQVMDARNMNICTVEEPVEYQLPRITQINVNEPIGLSFAATLRSLLRQDPDVIMVGEIRDGETARVAIQAALTGHLVLSTLHTNDAPASIIRLMNIGVEPYLISAALNAVLAQRLVRRICPACKVPVEQVDDNTRAYLDKHGMRPDQIFRGAGCEKCHKTGHKGRLGIYEFMTINEDLRDLISRGPAPSDLRRAAHAAGMTDLRSDGLRKVALGQTTIQEVMAATET